MEASIINIDDIESVEVIDKEFVYDIEVEDNHNFYLDNSEKGILVHNSGKSEIVDAMCVGYAFKYKFKTAFCSPENKPNKFHTDKILRKIIGYRPSERKHLNSQRYKDGIEFVNEYFHHINYDEGYDLKTVLKKFEELVKRKGIRVFVLDPYNKIKLKSSEGKNINDKTGDYLNEIDIFCKKHQVIVLLVAHPNKMRYEEGTKTFTMPTAYDVKGGGEMYDMAYHMLGFVKDNERGMVRGEVLKCKFQHLGVPNAEFWLKWNFVNGRYESFDYDPEMGDISFDNWDNGSWLLNKNEPITSIDYESGVVYEKTSNYTENEPYNPNDVFKNQPNEFLDEINNKYDEHEKINDYDCPF